MDICLLTTRGAVVVARDSYKRINCSGGFPKCGIVITLKALFPNISRIYFISKMDVCLLTTRGALAVLQDSYKRPN